MKLIIGLIAIGGAFLAGPLFMEGTQTACSALESRIVALAGSQSRSVDRAGTLLLGNLVANASQGAMAAAYVQQNYPNLPPVVGCATAYWQILINGAKDAQAQ